MRTTYWRHWVGWFAAFEIGFLTQPRLAFNSHPISVSRTVDGRPVPSRLAGKTAFAMRWHLQHPFSVTDNRWEQPSQARKPEVQWGERGWRTLESKGIWHMQQHPADRKRWSVGSHTCFVCGTVGCAQGLTRAVRLFTAELHSSFLFTTFKGRSMRYTRSRVGWTNYQVTCNNATWWSWGLKDGSEVRFSTSMEVWLCSFQRLYRGYSFPRLRDPLLHLQRHWGDITALSVLHLCLSSKNPCD